MLSIRAVAVVACSLRGGLRRIVTQRGTGRDLKTAYCYGADGFAHATQGNLDTLVFAMNNRRIRFVLELPNPEDFRHTNHNPPPGAQRQGP